jgi:hypothetical protein
MTTRRRAGLASAATVFAALVVFGCGGELLLAPLPDAPREATLFDLFGEPVVRPAGFDLATGPLPVRTDLSSQWDWVFAVVPPGGAAGCLAGQAAGTAWFLPRGCFEGLDASSGLFRATVPFDSLLEAPGDERLFVRDAAQRVDVGAVFVVRSRPDPALASVGSTCRRYAKLEVLELDAGAGRVRFRYLWNPNCNRRSFRPEG